MRRHLVFFLVHLIVATTESAYLYHYASDVSVYSDERIASHKLLLSLEADLSVTPVWAAEASQPERLLRFQLENVHLRGATNNSAGKVLQETSDLSTKSELLQRPFFARIIYGKIQDLFVRKDNVDIELVNLQRGIVSLFQFQSGNWEGQETDILGSCWTSYTNDHHGLHKKKTKCENNNNVDQREVSTKELFGARRLWSYDGVYHLQRDEDEVVSSLQLVEVLKQEMNLPTSNPRWIKVTHKLQLKGQTNNENQVLGSNFQEALSKVEAREKTSFQKSDLQAQNTHSETQSTKLKNLIPKLKRQLRPDALATLSGAKAFLQVRSAVMAASTEDLVAILKDKRNQDVLPQLMDVLGSSEAVAGHKAMVETYGTPSQTNRADLYERYFWALAQAKAPSTFIVQEVFTFAKDKIANLKLRETTILTLGTLAKKSTDLTLSASILKWLVHSMVESCKDDACIQIYLRAIENSDNVSAAPILLTLVETSSNKKTAFAAIKSFAHLMTSHTEEVKSKIGSDLLQPRLMSLFDNRKVDSSVRGLVGELLLLLLRTKPEPEVVRGMMTTLRQETNKGFVSFVLSRMVEFAETSETLKNLFRTSVNKGYIDWNLLAHGGLSTSFGRQVASAGRAGNSSFSFGMEVSGAVLKRSNFQLFFEGKNGEKTDFVQLGVFAGGMSSFIDDGSKGNNDDNEEATAGIEMKFLGNQLRPFVFFNSMGELMSLYWSGAAEGKNSALQGSTMLQNEKFHLILSNGISAFSSTEGVISYDFSGQAKVSMWSKQSETLIDNSVAYHLQNKLDLTIWPDLTLVKYNQMSETEMTLKVENNLNFGSGGIKGCIRVSQPELHIDHQTSKIIKQGKTQAVNESRRINIPGKTLFLNQQNCDLCNKMYPKTK